MPDAPDGVKLIELGVVVGGAFIPSEAANESLVLEVDTLTTTDTSYGTIVTYTVTTAKTLMLTAIEMDSTDFDHTLFQLVIGGVTIFTDLAVQNPYSPPLPAPKYAAGTVITLSAKSTDGTSITVYGDIIGKELG